MARDVLMERRVAQAGTLQARSTAVDTEAWNEPLLVLTD